MPAATVGYTTLSELSALLDYLIPFIGTSECHQQSCGENKIFDHIFSGTGMLLSVLGNAIFKTAQNKKIVFEKGNVFVVGQGDNGIFSPQCGRGADVLSII